MTWRAASRWPRRRQMRAAAAAGVLRVRAAVDWSCRAPVSDFGFGKVPPYPIFPTPVVCLLKRPTPLVFARPAGRRLSAPSDHRSSAFLAPHKWGNTADARNCETAVAERNIRQRGKQKCAMTGSRTPVSR
eukprot:306638-Chlamydomonas_euryale.AAC.1